MLPGVAVLRVRQSRPASAVHTVFCSVVPWFVKGLRCLRADPRVLFRTFLHVLRVAACGLVVLNTTRSPPLRALPRVEGVVFRLVVNSAMPCLRPLLCVAGNTSLLEPVPRRSVSQTANCTSRQALLCFVSRDRPRWSFLPSRPCAGGHPMSPLCTSLL